MYTTALIFPFIPSSIQILLRCQMVRLKFISVGTFSSILWAAMHISHDLRHWHGIASSKKTLPALSKPELGRIIPRCCFLYIPSTLVLSVPYCRLPCLSAEISILFTVISTSRRNINQVNYRKRNSFVTNYAFN